MAHPNKNTGKGKGKGKGKARTSSVTSPPKNKINNVESTGVRGDAIAKGQDHGTVITAFQAIVNGDVFKFLSQERFKDSGFRAIDMAFSAGLTGKGTGHKTLTTKEDADPLHVASYTISSVRHDDGNYQASGKHHLAGICSEDSPTAKAIADTLQAVVSMRANQKRARDHVAKLERQGKVQFANNEDREQAIRARGSFVPNSAFGKGLIPSYKAVMLEAGPQRTTGSNTVSYPLPTLSKEGLKYFAAAIKAGDAIMRPIQPCYAPEKQAPKKSSKAMLALGLDCDGARLREFRASIGLEGKGSSTEHARQCKAALVAAGLLAPDMIGEVAAASTKAA
jgi:hypothetical protein